MRKLFFRYLAGLDSLYSKQNYPDIWVMAVIVLFQALLAICIGGFYSTFFKVKLPTFSQWGNKWVVRITFAAVLILLNQYILGVDEKKYSRVDPLPKGTTLAITGVGLGSLLLTIYLLMRMKS